MRGMHHVAVIIVIIVVNIFVIIVVIVVATIVVIIVVITVIVVVIVVIIVVVIVVIIVVIITITGLVTALYDSDQMPFQRLYRMPSAIISVCTSSSLESRTSRARSGRSTNQTRIFICLVFNSQRQGNSCPFQLIMEHRSRSNNNPSISSIGWKRYIRLKSWVLWFE